VHITTHWREGLQLKKGAEAVRHAPVGEPTSGLEPLTCSLRVSLLSPLKPVKNRRFAGACDLAQKQRFTVLGGRK